MWKNKNVWIVLSGEFVAGLGLWFGIIGNLEFMQKNVPSDFMKSLILFIGLLAGVLVGPLAGRMIDSCSKKTVLIYSGFGRMLSVIFMFMAIQFDSLFFMILFMISIQLSAAFYFPALQAVIPIIVKDNDLIQMNGVHMNIATMARVIGTALAGALLVFMSLTSIYAMSMAAYAILFGATFLLDFKEEKREPSASGKSGSFKEVLPVLKATPIAITALVLTIIPVLFIGGFNLMVINISELQDSTSIKGLLYTVEGIAFMIGAFFVKKITSRFSSVSMLFAFALIISIAHLSLFFSDIMWMSLISFGLFGLGVGCFFPIVSTIFQTKIPKEYHGRFFSFRNMLDRVMFQVVLLGTGLFLDTIGLQFMVLIFGTLSLLMVVIYGMNYFQKTEAGSLSESK